MKRNSSNSGLPATQSSASFERSDSPASGIQPKARTASPAADVNINNKEKEKEIWNRQDENELEEDDRDDFGTAAISNVPNKPGEADDDTSEKVRTRYLLESFDEEQMQRYEVFRRANLNKTNVKKLANQILNQSVTPNVAIVISGFSKVFVGEIIELARRIQEHWGDTGPLSPDHLREAYRLSRQNQRLIPKSRRSTKFFR
ncbi:transcription factor TFIID complex subunit Taf11 [Schizosaccharomyces cryophilus OY26]|uniref:Transcription initiation factor TFIID subunit 11 n=1 Tax=Schizosaccharomyces cryophilus (strain OY26 / ATCC MYA-4695 / CBS 11777 / NBRC 106824 / NRRL Y48691) TaxID=653667 RepID=S9X8G7_SCHCR|nr:transcription factor TFIID complex subunit Taf11 [Schizosaccharomyces cryophilus OY26]EPY53422.1 transcription factor TFIID complex subunit Taf11 [Schizosaccharomyces cryophilus OY26]